MVSCQQTWLYLCYCIYTKLSLSLSLYSVDAQTRAFHVCAIFLYSWIHVCFVVLWCEISRAHTYNWPYTRYPVHNYNDKKLSRFPFHSLILLWFVRCVVVSYVSKQNNCKNLNWLHWRKCLTCRRRACYLRSRCWFDHMLRFAMRTAQTKKKKFPHIVCIQKKNASDAVKTRCMHIYVHI